MPDHVCHVMISLQSVSAFTLRKGDIQRLKDLMKQKGFTWIGLSDALGDEVSLSTVRKVLRADEVNISKEKLTAICDCLEVGIESIVDSSTINFKIYP